MGPGELILFKFLISLLYNVILFIIELFDNKFYKNEDNYIKIIGIISLISSILIILMLFLLFSLEYEDYKKFSIILFIIHIIFIILESILLIIFKSKTIEKYNYILYNYISLFINIIIIYIIFKTRRKN